MKTMNLKKSFPYFLTEAGVIGLIASFVLTIERLELLKNPNYVPTCGINPVVSCGPIMKSDQAMVFGFPNPLLGLVAFGVIIAVGMSLLAGAKMKQWYWRAFSVFISLGMLSVVWLIHESLYEIGALCLYCMVVWSVVWPMFIYGWLWVYEQKALPKKTNKLFDLVSRHHADIVLAGYLIVIALILNRFWYYWSSLI